MSATPSPLAAAASQLAGLALRDAWVELEAAVAAAPESQGPAARLAAESLCQHKRWEPAARLAALVPAPGAADICRLNLSRNMAALRRLRPGAFAVLDAGSLGSRYRLATSAAEGRWILVDHAGPRPFCLTAGGEPERAADDAMRSLGPAMALGKAIGMVGVGDGHLLGRIAAARPKLLMDQTLAVHVIEPDPALLLAVLLMHDYTGTDGPIEQPRFRWHVGPGWRAHLEAELRADMMLPPPHALVEQSVERASLRAQVNEVSDGLHRLMEEQALGLRRWSGGLGPAAVALRIRDPLGGPGDRPPRVLILTSRFTTVLQYAARDTAAALRELGWEAVVFIEMEGHHRALAHGIQQAMLDTKPDVIFMFDHLRRGSKDLYPAPVPVVSWFQDHLGHLTTVEAGRGVGPLDFVLTCAAPFFEGTYGYPARQLIDMPLMLTQPQPRPVSWESDGDDLVYVSNMSGAPGPMVEELASKLPEEVRPLTRRVGRAMLDHYAAGGALPTYHDLRGFIRAAEAGDKTYVLHDAGRAKLVELLWNPLNITLYRQQGLGWALAAAKELGLRAGLHGRGWELNPAYAPFARGVVEHGEPLAALTRSSKINLNLEPYTCFTHQRMLDGLAAGGFLLVRDHPTHRLLQDLSNFLADHVGVEARTTPDARLSCPAAHRPALEDLLRRSACVCFDQDADAVRQVRCWERAGVLVRQAEALPGLAEVSFHDAASCLERVRRFVSDGDARRRISAAQWANVRDRLTFKAGMSRVMRRVADLLSEPRP